MRQGFQKINIMTKKIFSEERGPKFEIFIVVRPLRDADNFQFKLMEHYPEESRSRLLRKH